MDCPTDKVSEAEKFLTEEFDKIGGEVRKVMNPHDFGSYLSFEIDCPQEIEEAKNRIDDVEYEDNMLGDDDIELLEQKVSDWHDKANQVEEAYSNKFGEWL